MRMINSRCQIPVGDPPGATMDLSFDAAWTIELNV